MSNPVDNAATSTAIQPCNNPKPVYWDGNMGYWKTHPKFICSECGYTLSLLEYEQGGNRMSWWRHCEAPIMMAAVV